MISIKMSERKSIIYFSKPGEADADEAMKAALERAKELGIRDIVVASTRGGDSPQGAGDLQGIQRGRRPSCLGVEGDRLPRVARGNRGEDQVYGG